MSRRRYRVCKARLGDLLWPGRDERRFSILQAMYNARKPLTDDMIGGPMYMRQKDFPDRNEKHKPNIFLFITPLPVYHHKTNLAEYQK